MTARERRFGRGGGREWAKRLARREARWLARGGMLRIHSDAAHRRYVAYAAEFDEMSRALLDRLVALAMRPQQGPRDERWIAEADGRDDWFKA